MGSGVLTLKAMQVRGLKEEAAAGGEIIAGIRHEGTVLEIAFLKQRTVTRVENAARHEFVRGQPVCQETVAGTVELLDGADQEMFVELVGALEIHNVNGVDTLSGRGAIEPHGVVADVLIHVQVWLQGDAAPSRR